MRSTERELFQVGVVAGIHGLRGDLKVRLTTDGSPALLAAREVWLARANDESRRCVPVRAVRHKKNILLRLQGVEDARQAEQLVGSDVLMALADLPEAAADENYWFELAGMTVTDRRRGELGRLDELFSTAAHDIYVVNGPFGEVLIPAVKQFVLEIDRENRVILVDLPDGLVAAADAL